MHYVARQVDRCEWRVEAALTAGDFVDRGSWGLEVLLLLGAWLLAMPQSVTLLRGNHEGATCTAAYGFQGELIAKYGPEAQSIYSAAEGLFQALPLAAHIAGDNSFAQAITSPHGCTWWSRKGTSSMMTADAAARALIECYDDITLPVRDSLVVQDRDINESMILPGHDIHYMCILSSTCECFAQVRGGQQLDNCHLFSPIQCRQHPGGARRAVQGAAKQAKAAQDCPQDCDWLPGGPEGGLQRGR